ncbi:unnamed protein product [Phyllotreta striolata]|uniref:Serine/arginine repetitive matrix protein 1 n=1 Tax=Phyllotreta striolata TaxID=444603 RepID=A0A9N9TX07_PHYSR|nr:unnamed protein product [Phyllotreta striolata]
MSSRRRSRSREKVVKSKLRMDTKPVAIRITDPSLPAGRRREIDNVMKRARSRKSPNSGVFWDRKLLEVEAKDPNRWTHSGYKSLYLDGSSSPSSNGKRSRSRSPSKDRSRGRQRGGGRPSPPPPQAPPMRRSSPPPSSSSSMYASRSARSPPPPRSRSRSRASPPPAAYRRPPRSPPSPRRDKKRSASNSSISSCSDDSCSVCSPKGHRSARSRSRSFSPPPRPRKVPSKTVASSSKARPRGVRPPSPASAAPRRVPKPVTPPPQMAARKPQKSTASDRPTDPRRRPPPPRPRGGTGEIIDLGAGVKPPKPGAAGKKVPGEKAIAKPMLLKRIKKERTGPRAGSPGAESSCSGDSGGPSSGGGTGAGAVPAPIVSTTSLTLSERFGKIAQWSADRERREMENMKITKTGGNMKVLLEEDEFLYGSPPRRYSLSPVPIGHFPDKLSSSNPSRSAAWDDVRVRYQHYKDLGYLRDLSLDDYVKWEEWWYKYQDWLANERHYEHWLATHGGGGSSGGGRRRGGAGSKKRLPASQRLN